MGLCERTPWTPLRRTESKYHHIPSTTLFQSEHAPKPILLNTGEYYIPFQWHPVHVDTQVSFIKLSFEPPNPSVSGSPYRPTPDSSRPRRVHDDGWQVEPRVNILSSRRLRETVAASWEEECTVVLAGLANSYTHYITTWEEYQTQRFVVCCSLCPLPFYQV